MRKHKTLASSKPEDGHNMSKDSTEMLDIIHEVRDVTKAEKNLAGIRKGRSRDKNFEAFKEYNKRLLSFPVMNDPFMSHKRQLYIKARNGPTVFDRLTVAAGKSVEVKKPTQTSHSVEKAPGSDSASVNYLRMNTVAGSSSGNAGLAHSPGLLSMDRRNSSSHQTATKDRSDSTELPKLPSVPIQSSNQVASSTSNQILKIRSVEK